MPLDVYVYIDKTVAELDKRIDARLLGMEKATELTRQSMEAKFGLSNEWKDRYKEREEEYITKREHKYLTDDVAAVKNELSYARGRASQGSVWIGYAIAFIALCVSVLTLILK